MDIVAILKNCANNDVHNCESCPLYRGSYDCISVLLQKAALEIEKLRSD